MEKGITQLRCCFCGDLVDHGPIDPCSLVLTARWARAASDRKEQQFWCHAKCANKQLRKATVTKRAFVREVDAT